MADTVSAPAPIPGRSLDPPVKEMAHTLRAVNDKSEAAGVAFRAFIRFSGAKTSLLSAGTTYYLFLAVFAIMAMAFGITALLGAYSTQVANTLSHTLESAFPALMKGNGIDTATLRSFGSNASIIGLLVLLYSGSGAMNAASESIRQIYGAPRDPRNIVLSRARLMGWLFIIAPLILLSFAPSIIVTNFAEPMMQFLGLPADSGQEILFALSLLLSLALNFWVVYLMLGHMGGIRPELRAIVIGSLFGMIAIEILKYLMGAIIAWSVAKPQYGAFATPIAILFVLNLLTMMLYLSAALCGAVAEKDEPIELTPEAVGGPDPQASEADEPGTPRESEGTPDVPEASGSKEEAGHVADGGSRS